MESKEFITILGDTLEGGGQVIRQSVALAAILKIPIRCVRIRAKRPKGGGLRAQHLTGIQLVTNVCQGTLKGAAVKSAEFDFTPGQLSPGKYFADAVTAGSVCLLIQVSLPCFMLSGGDCTVELRGGTNASHAPPVDHTLLVLKPYLERFGTVMDMEVQRRGYFPKGGGIVHVRTSPPKKGVFQAVDLTSRGELVKIEGRAYVAGRVPFHVAERMRKAALQVLGKRYPQIPITIETVQETSKTAFGTGTGVFLTAHTSTGCILAGDCLGERGLRAEVVGQRAAVMLVENVDAHGCVDEHLQDQLIIYMALAKGVSRMLCGPLTLHTETAIHFAKLVAGVVFKVTPQPPLEDGIPERFLVECEGLGCSC